MSEFMPSQREVTPEELLQISPHNGYTASEAKKLADAGYVYVTSSSVQCPPELRENAFVVVDGKVTQMAFKDTKEPIKMRLRSKERKPSRTLTILTAIGTFAASFGVVLVAPTGDSLDSIRDRITGSSAEAVALPDETADADNLLFNDSETDESQEEQEVIGEDQEPVAESVGLPNISEDLPASEQLGIFVDHFKDLAIEVEDKYEIPYEVVLAMAVHESGYGRSGIAQAANNLFGLKENDQWRGETYPTVTYEEIRPEQIDNFDVSDEVEPIELSNGNLRVLVKGDDATFQSYSSVEDSFDQFGWYIKNREKPNQDGNLSIIYEDAFGLSDPVEFLEKLLDKDEEGEWQYATASEYVTNVTPIIISIQERNNA